MSDQKKNKAQVFKASMELQEKAGTGPLDEKIVAKAQNVIDNNEVDFTELGMQILGKLQTAVKTASDAKLPMEERKHVITAPVMELKANAAIFKYDLIGMLAGIMMGFLESIDDLDKDAIDIVDAHHKTLTLIVVKKMRGDGGQNGQILVKELKDACGRYYAKKKKG